MNVHDYPICDHVPNVYRVELLYNWNSGLEWYCIASFLNAHAACVFARDYNAHCPIRVRDRMNGAILYDRIPKEDDNGRSN